MANVFIAYRAAIRAVAAAMGKATCAAVSFLSRCEMGERGSSALVGPLRAHRLCSCKDAMKLSAAKDCGLQALT